jgi:hypothetical protein
MVALYMNKNIHVLCIKYLTQFARRIYFISKLNAENYRTCYILFQIVHNLTLCSVVLYKKINKFKKGRQKIEFLTETKDSILSAQYVITGLRRLILSGLMKLRACGVELGLILFQWKHWAECLVMFQGKSSSLLQLQMLKQLQYLPLCLLLRAEKALVFAILAVFWFWVSLL